MAEKEKKEEIAGEVGDENVDLNEPETKKLKLDAEVFVELASSPEVPSTTPSKKSRSKVSKEEREAEKARKAEERRIKDEERKREKDRIAEEKRLEKERKDKEREEKKKEELRIKEEKKKAQDEAKEQKKKDEEEKQRQKTLKKKEEEERQDAKRREELEEIKKKQRESQKFLGFFKKLNKEGSDESEAPEEHLKKVWYKPFRHKAGAVRAPVHRRATLSVDVDLLTQHAEITTATYLSSAAVKNRKLKCARKDKLKAKLFQFHDNFRPPYYGSWRKKDTGIKPKRPWLPSSQALDYEADSDADWENEPDDGDECKSDEEDPEVDEQQDSDADEFMVEPGYLSDGEGQEESDESNERDAEGRAERLAARASEWKRNVLNKSKVLIPVCVGPTFEPTSSLLAYPVYILP